MTIQEKEILNRFYLKKISKEEFLEQYSVDFTKDKRHIFLSIKQAYDNKNADDLELTLTLILFDRSILYTNEMIELLCDLLREKWHYQHENIARILQGIRSPKSIDTLYETALTKFDYLNYDDSIPLAIICIHALSDINTDYAKEKLRLLAKSDILRIKEKAEKHLYHYK